jgi:predicted nucleotide-binding protein (sugar kinase/HSP70/actin superfamily)
MGVVRIDDKLIKEVQKWLEENGNKYKHPTLSAFVNNAVYEKLKQLKKEKEGKQ